MKPINLLDAYEAATGGSSPELVKSMRRIENGIERCWVVHRESQDFMGEWNTTSGNGLSTFDMMNELMENGRMGIVEMMNQDDPDVELAYVAWLAFQRLGERVEEARTNVFA
jgi:hypothetical protein